MALIDSIVAYYKLDGVSPTLVDAVNAYSLTPHNITAGTGKIAGCATFDGSTSYAAVASNADLQLAGPKSFSVWVKLADKSATSAVLGKWSSSPNNEFICEYYQPTDRFFFAASLDGTAFALASADTFGSPSINTWYFLTFGWDDAGQVWIQVNAGARDTAALAGTPVGGLTNAFTIGRNDGGGGAEFWPGSIDELGIWNRVLTVDEVTALYGGSAGQAYPFTGPGTTVPVTDSNLVFSPFNWYFSGSTYAQSNNPGAYLRASFTGTSLIVNVDVSPLTDASFSAGNYPTIAYSVDGAAYTRRQLTSSDAAITLASGLSAGTHDVEIWFASVTIGIGGGSAGDRWTTPANVVRITSLTIDAGASTAAPTPRAKRAIVLGDSITEGVNCVGVGNSNAAQDATQTYAALLGPYLGAEVGIVGFSAQGWEAAGFGNVPEFASSWGFYSGGKSRLSSGLLSPAPDYIVVNQGTNASSGAQAAAAAFLGAIRAAAPAAGIYLLVPFGGQERAEVTGGFGDYQGSTPDANAFLIDLGVAIEETISGTRNSNDGLHPSARGHATFAAMTARAIAAAETGGGGGGGARSGGGRHMVFGGTSSLKLS